MFRAASHAALFGFALGTANFATQVSGAPVAFESIAAVPQDTTSFVAFCHTHEEFCANAVTDVENGTLIDILYGGYGCPYPKPSGNTVAERHLVHVSYANRILAWLENNGNSRAATTKEAVKQAMAALWPSQCHKG